MDGSRALTGSHGLPRGDRPPARIEITIYIPLISPLSSLHSVAARLYVFDLPLTIDLSRAGWVFLPFSRRFLVPPFLPGPARPGLISSIFEAQYH